MQHLSRLWAGIEDMARVGNVLQVAVALTHLSTADQRRQMELFVPKQPPRAHDAAKREQLSVIVDQLNRKLGRDTVAIGMVNLKLQPHTGAKIAFKRVPQRWEFEERKTTPDALIKKFANKYRAGRQRPAGKPGLSLGKEARR